MKQPVRQAGMISTVSARKPNSSDPDLYPTEGEMNVETQIVGQHCKICRRMIVFFDEGKFCARCGTFVHRSCLPQIECDVCRQPFQLGKLSKPLRSDESTISNSARSSRDDGPMLVISLLLVSLLLGLMILSFRYGLDHMHAK